MDLELIHQLGIAVVRRPEVGFCDFPIDNLGNPLRDPLLDVDCHKEKTFCRLASSCASLLFAISGSTVMLSVLAQSSAALDAASTSLFLMWIVDLYLLSVFLTLL